MMHFWNTSMHKDFCCLLGGSNVCQCFTCWKKGEQENPRMIRCLKKIPPWHHPSSSFASSKFLKPLKNPQKSILNSKNSPVFLQFSEASSCKDRQILFKKTPHLFHCPLAGSLPGSWFWWNLTSMGGCYKWFSPPCQKKARKWTYQKGKACLPTSILQEINTWVSGE